MSQKLTIGHLYPDLLNLYGDSGNIASLKQRCVWRGMDVDVIAYELQDEIDFTKLDIVLLGGGSDREQKMVCQKLNEIKSDFQTFVEDGGVLLAVCGGFEMIGTSYETEEGTVEGIGLLDIHTENGPDRLMGNVALQSDLVDMPVVGFENHSGRMHLGEYTPFGKVLSGKGNDGESGMEGVVYKNVIGTHLYGPLLPKNPKVCDWLIQRALERKYGEVELAPLEDTLEEAGNQYIYNRIMENKG